MSLSAALRTAHNTLATRSAQTAVTSRNIAGESDPTYSRKIAAVSTGFGGTQSVSIRRATDLALYTKMIDTTSGSAAQQAVLAGLGRLSETLGDPELDGGPAAAVQALQNALQSYAAAPSNVTLAQSAVTAAGSLATALNEAAATVQSVRQEADGEIAASVTRINELLAQFETVNIAVMKGTFTGADITDQLDARDAIVAQLSEEIGVTVVFRANNDAVLYTDSGVTLFETRARSVTFGETDALGPGQTGRAVHVDGVPVIGDTGMPVKSGRIQGLSTLRDVIAPAYGIQLDEMARGLVEAFAESDQGTPATLPDRPGLFTWPGAPAMPAGATIVPGLARDIRVNPNVDPAQGGNLSLLRDGGISDPGNPAYRSNPGTSASFSDRLQELVEGFDATRGFDPASGLTSTATLGSFAASSAGWLEGLRANASTDADFQSVLLQRTSEALSNATGVNIDDEMSALLDLERSYQASAKLIAAIDAMLAALMEAT